MSERPKRVEHEHRDFTPEEDAMFQEALRDFEAEKDKLMAWAKAGLARDEAIRGILRALRSARLKKGVSLSQVEEASGLGRSVVSRLENVPHANPTLETLLRYAEAIGVELRVAVVDKRTKSKKSDAA